MVGSTRIIPLPTIGSSLKVVYNSCSSFLHT